MDSPSLKYGLGKSPMGSSGGACLWGFCLQCGVQNTREYSKFSFGSDCSLVSDARAVNEAVSVDAFCPQSVGPSGSFLRDGALLNHTLARLTCSFRLVNVRLFTSLPLLLLQSDSSNTLEHLHTTGHL